MDYDIGTGFTESNVTQYLAELEEYISSLITYCCFKRNEEFAAISSIPLERLSKPKDKNAQIQIDLPATSEINYDKINLEELNELGLPQKSKEDDMINNAADLFKKFQYLRQKEAISFPLNANKQHQT